MPNSRLPSNGVAMVGAMVLTSEARQLNSRLGINHSCHYRRGRFDVNCINATHCSVHLHGVNWKELS